MSVHFKSRMFNLKDRFGISDTSWDMLKAYDDYKTGRIDEAELGRKVRLSPNGRTCMMDTLLECAQIMNTSPEERNRCTDIILALGDMVKMSQKPPENLSFPFMKLPKELRRMVYELYINSNMKHKGITVVTAVGRSHCHCPQGSYGRAWNVLKFHLGETSKHVREEFMTAFYQRFIFSFPCACDMGYQLGRNPLLKQEVQKIKFHWTGPAAHTDISLLLKLKLRFLRVIISKETGRYITQKEQEFRRYFQTKKGAQNCITESLGIEELMALRGIQAVQVVHASRTVSQLRTEADRKGLERLLQAKITAPRDDDDDDI
ncbi:hypothetical protein F4818DRAFT_439116 [Hypoxylon cercidicola]|nr:hypothetical protein F4818DRAFT_439116 [Hypoxylon cercidicola]